MLWLELLWIILHKNWTVYGLLNNDDVRKAIILFTLLSAEHLESYFSDTHRHRLNIENGLDVSTRNNQRLLKRVCFPFLIMVYSW